MNNTGYSVDGFNLLCITPQDSGIGENIWLKSSGNAESKPSIPSVYLMRNSSLIAVDILPCDETECSGEIMRWIKANEDVLIQHWNNEITDGELFDSLVIMDALCGPAVFFEINKELSLFSCGYDKAKNENGVLRYPQSSKEIWDKFFEEECKLKFEDVPKGKIECDIENESILVYYDKRLEGCIDEITCDYEVKNIIYFPIDH